MLEPDQQTMTSMATVARARARSWHLFGEVVSTPTPDFVARLRDGRFRDEVAETSSWLGDGSPFATHLSTLQAFVTRSKRFPLEHDLTSLRDEWTRLFGEPDASGQTELGVRFTAAAESCEAEAEAWERGDHASAKQHRLDQFRTLTDELEPMVAWCRTLEHETRVLVGKVLARLVAAHLSAESGRDLVTGVMSPAEPRA